MEACSRTVNMGRLLCTILKGNCASDKITTAAFTLPPELAEQCLARYQKLAQGEERYERGPLGQ